MLYDLVPLCIEVYLFFQCNFFAFFLWQILTDAALLKRQKKEIEELRAKLMVDLAFFCHFFLNT